MSEKEWKGNSEEGKKKERERKNREESAFLSNFYMTGNVLNISHELSCFIQGRKRMIR